MKLSTIKSSPAQVDRHNLLMRIERGIRSYKPEIFYLPEGYSSLPCAKQIFRNNGICENLTIKSQYGQVQWKGLINLSKLNQSLAQTIKIQNLQIQVYLNDCGKPPIGQELNRSCIATINLNKHAHAQRCIKICNKNGTKFIKLHQNQLTVFIPHFTRYSFNEDNQNEPKVKRNQSNNNQIRRHNTIDQRNRQQRNTFQPAIQQNHIKYPYFSQQMRQSEVYHRQRTQKQLRFDDDKFIQIQYSDYQDYISTDNQIKNNNNNKNQLKNKNIKKQINTTQIIQQDIIFKTNNKQLINMEQQQSFYNIFIKNKSFDNVNIINIIKQNNKPFYVKRLFLLYSLLFHEKIYFQIKRNYGEDYQIIIIDQQQINSLKFKQQRFKSWLAWVIANDYQNKIQGNKLIETKDKKIIKALALRKPEMALNYLLINNRMQQAQAICNLQDSSFIKKCQKNTTKQNQQKYCKQIKDIIFNSAQKSIISSQWLINFAFRIWYGQKNDFMTNLAQVINQFGLHKIQNYTHQLRLIQIFLQSKGFHLKMPYLPPINNKRPSQEHIISYIISNQLNLQQFQRKLYQNQLQNTQYKNYQNYRYKLIIKLISIFKHKDINFLINLIQKDNGINNKQKNIILDQLKLQKHQREINSYGQEQILIEGKAKQLLEKNLYLQGLMLLFKIDKWTCKMYKQICKILTKQELLVHYRRQDSEKLLEILNIKSKQFEDLIILLISRQRLLNNLQFTRLVEIIQGKSKFYQFFNESIHSYMLFVLQKNVFQSLILHNKTYHELISNKQLAKRIKIILHDRLQILQRLEENLLTF